MRNAFNLDTLRLSPKQYSQINFSSLLWLKYQFSVLFTTLPPSVQTVGKNTYLMINQWRKSKGFHSLTELCKVSSVDNGLCIVRASMMSPLISREVMLLNIKKALDLTLLHWRSGYLWSGVVFTLQMNLRPDWEHLWGRKQAGCSMARAHRSGNMFPCFSTLCLRSCFLWTWLRSGVVTRLQQLNGVCATQDAGRQRLLLIPDSCSGWRDDVFPPRIRRTQQHLWQSCQVSEEKQEWNRKPEHLWRTLREEVSYTAVK